MPDPLPHTTPKQEEEQDINEAISAIAVKDKIKADREAKWLQNRKVYDDAIVELKSEIRGLQAAIRELKEKEDWAKRGWVGGPYGILAWTLVWFLSRYLGWIKGLFWGDPLHPLAIEHIVSLAAGWLWGNMLFVFLVSFVGSLFGIFSFSKEEREERERVKAECRRCLEIKMRDLKIKERELREWEEGLRGMEREEKGEALREGFLVRLLQFTGRAMRYW
jgi:hypothetical protein